MSVINTNITSMIGQQNLKESQNALSTSMERLSSGLRINSAKDDAAGQAIANRFTSQITGLGQAQRNANDGISIAQTAEGGLNQVNDNLQRVRELTVQAQNGTNSQSDLESIQNEINQRMSEIDRISEETDFNGTKVLAEDSDLKIQVGANDGQTISVGLQQITGQTLGLDGFNVDGGGVTQNTTATVNDLSAAGATESGAGTGIYELTTTNKAADLSSVTDQLQDGNTASVSGGNAYTFNADTGSFDFTNTALATDATQLTATAERFLPEAGQTTTGTYEYSDGNSETFEVDAQGVITIDDQAAYISSAGELTKNSGGGSVAATAENLLTAVSEGSAAGERNLTVEGTTYSTSGTADTIDFEDSITRDQFLAAAEDTDVTFELGQGEITEDFFVEGSGGTAYKGTNSGGAQAYINSDDALSTVASFDTEYTVDPANGGVTVSEVSADDNNPPEVGATVYVNSEGGLTTEETSQGDRTEDPLAALDAALSKVDGLRSDLGAIQNRFESAITNLSTNETNLSAARSRIEDADYATEVANMTRAQILQQAGTSVLAQANQIPQNVLSLLG